MDTFFYISLRKNVYNRWEYTGMCVIIFDWTRENERAADPVVLLILLIDEDLHVNKNWIALVR